MVRPTLVLAVAATLLTSCVGSTELQVLERANREAKAAGYDLRHYRASAHYNFREANDTWVVFYEGIGDAKGTAQWAIISPFMFPIVAEKLNLCRGAEHAKASNPYVRCQM